MDFSAPSRSLLPPAQPSPWGAGPAGCRRADAGRDHPCRAGLRRTARTHRCCRHAAAAPAQSALIGFNGARLSDSDAQLGANLDAVRNAGATWIRLDVDWSQIEPNPGSSDFSGPDRVVDAARSRGLQVLAIATYTPRWAQDVSVATGTSHGRPSSPGAAGP